MMYCRLSCVAGNVFQTVAGDKAWTVLCREPIVWMPEGGYTFTCEVCRFEMLPSSLFIMYTPCELITYAHMQAKSRQGVVTGYRQCQ